MDQNTLRDQLAKLHDELTRAQQENPAARRSIDEILPDLKRMVDQASASAAAASPASLPGRLERVAVQFEAAHPQLAASARRLIDLLGEVGI